MLTDWMLIRRAAAELDERLRGARVTDAGLLDDGRFALSFGGRRGQPPTTLAVDLFGSPPLVSLEEAELSLEPDPGWVRPFGLALRGMPLQAVRSRPGDRVLALDFGTTSRFGVREGYTLILELIPRFGNALLLRDGTVLAAAKQFSPAENEARSVTVGGPYRPPPQAAPSVPRLVADSIAAGGSAEPEAEPLAPLHVYREAGRLVAAHVVPLAQFAGLEHTQEPALLPLFAEARVSAVGRRSSDAVERRRAALANRIARRRRDLAAELEQVAARYDDAAGRERLRAAGDALHTYGRAIPTGATSFIVPAEPTFTLELDPELDAKANAARYFARYRKATDALPHLERRRAALTATYEGLDELASETERADAATLSEIAAALDELDGRKPQRAIARRARAPLRIDRPSGARIFVGRSPRENVDVTFRIARPDDLWFHARGIPGSHVVLVAAPGAPPSEEDLTLAADLAAHHSRARNAGRVEVDYTERKYVRKQRDAAPGLVWYTNARSRVGEPERAAQRAAAN